MFRTVSLPVRLWCTPDDLAASRRGAGGEGEKGGREGEGRTVNSYYQRHLTGKIPRLQWLVEGQNLRPRRTGISF